MKKSYDVELGTITLTFDGINAPVVVNVHEMPEDIQKIAVFHGLCQKIGDSAASMKTEEDRNEAIVAMIEQLQEGTWNKKGGSGSTYLLQALCRLYPGKDQTEIAKFLEGKTDDEKKALCKNAKVAVLLAEIRAEKSSSKARNDLLDELDEI